MILIPAKNLDRAMDRIRRHAEDNRPLNLDEMRDTLRVYDAFAAALATLANTASTRPNATLVSFPMATQWQAVRRLFNGGVL